MNNTFNITRFGLLLKRQWLEFGKIFLIILAVALGVVVTFYGFATWNAFFAPEFSPDISRILNFREPLFLIFGFLFNTVIASSYFAHLGQKPKAVIDLMIPASTFEKFLIGVLFTGFLATLSYLLIFYITDLAFVSKLRGLYTSVQEVPSYTDRDGETITKIDNLMYFFSKNIDDVFLPLYFTPLLISSLFLFGSIYFNRFHYIKTAISAMIFSGVWTAIIIKSGQILFDNRVPIERTIRNYHSRNDAELWMSLLFICATLIFWGFTYLRLKEKEV